MSIDKSGKPPVTLDDLKQAVGSEIGVSPWREITQAMIDRFADVTDDFNFIHVEPERARAETPFGGTIAHGFLSLAMLSTLAYETIPPLEGRAMGINYGFDSIRFAAPVPSGARVRAKFTLADVNIRPSGYVQIAYDVTMEIEGSVKPAFTARWLTIAVMEQAVGAGSAGNAQDD